MTLPASKGLTATDKGPAASGRWLSPMREPWPRAALRLLEQGESVVVRVLVAEVRGSAPREAGTSMLVARNETLGTIGGGNLEWQAMRAARSLMATSGPTTRSVQVWRLVLASELAQCCGGVVQLWLERFTADDLPFLWRAVLEWNRDSAILTEISGECVVRKFVQPCSAARLEFSATVDGRAKLLEPAQPRRPVLWLYGAGHVAQALIHILAGLPFEVTWIDARAELLPGSLPDNVHPLCPQAPVNTISSAPSGAHYLVMTHDHALDYALCKRALERNDVAWLGLIGSKSKGARFRARLARDGVAPEVIERLTCPIGIEGINSKLPVAIAIAVAAQLLQLVETEDGSGRKVAPQTSATQAAATHVGVVRSVAHTCPASDCDTCQASARKSLENVVAP